MKHILYILFVCFIFGCKPTNEVFVSNFSSMPLEFSSDTILFDTLIVNNKVSVTHRLYVFNTSSHSVNIDKIYLGNKNNSQFNLIVNGVLGKEFKNVELIGGDSLLILVNAVATSNSFNNLFVITDSINFTVENLYSKVILNSWGQEANFYNNDTLKGNILFDNTKTHVIYNNLIIDSLANLTITKGSNLLFYNGASIIVNGEIHVIGDKDNKVVFRAYRNDDDYSQLPGQWNGVKINSSYSNNIFTWVNILNATNAISFDKLSSASCIIDHTLIAYMSESGLKSYKGKFDVSNSVFYASMKNLVSVFGGIFNLINCSLDNFATGLGSNESSFYSDDSYSALNMNIINNVIWGNLSKEFDVNNINNNLSNLVIKKNIIKNDKVTIFSDNQYFSDNRKFKFKNASVFDFKPDTVSFVPLVLSPSIDNGESINGVTDNVDYYGNLRDLKPDIGAVEIILK